MTYSGCGSKTYPVPAPTMTENTPLLLIVSTLIQGVLSGGPLTTLICRPMNSYSCQYWPPRMWFRLLFVLQWIPQVNWGVGTNRAAPHGLWEQSISRTSPHNDQEHDLDAHSVHPGSGDTSEDRFPPDVMQVAARVSLNLLD